MMTSDQFCFTYLSYCYKLILYLMVWAQRLHLTSAAVSHSDEANLSYLAGH